jgi:hypothetical protein
MGGTVRIGRRSHDWDDSRDAKPIPEPEAVGHTPAVIWSGHFTDYSGYAKANREIMFRVANTLSVRLLRTGLEEGLIQVDPYTRRKVEAHRNVRVPDDSPLLRFFGPDYVPKERGRKIVWTMMETYKVHPQMVSMINHSYDELWTPTEWNGKVFEESGVRIPRRVVPLGANSLIYRKVPGQKLPMCRRITTSQAGEVGVPEGFIFLSVGLPSFRKGFDVVAEAFDKAFRGRKNVHLVFGITHSIPEWNKQVYEQFAGNKTSIWTLEGRYDEHEMARIYNASDCYVSASRGEGWNLPATEAAGCGIPVIVPYNTSHPEVAGSAAWFIDVDPTAPLRDAKKVSAWYDGMPFSTLGRKSVESLAEIMRVIERGGLEVETRAAGFQKLVHERWTWDRAALAVTERLLEVQP